MLSTRKAKMTSKVKNTEIKTQQAASMDEIDEWAAGYLDVEIIDNAVESSKKDQDAIRRKYVDGHYLSLICKQLTF